MPHYDVIIIGAGAAGMMCAAEAGRRGRSVLIFDHAGAPGEKIRISGGGRCNFTNLNASPANFISRNPHFCKSALARYTQHDFIALVDRHRIAWHEKTLGRLFCDGSAKEIIAMLVAERGTGGVELCLQTSVDIDSVEKTGDGFRLTPVTGTSAGSPLTCASLVIATGGKSIPKMGATGFGYRLAEKFGLGIVETRPGLAPLTFDKTLLERLKPLVGVAVDAAVTCGRTRFDEAILFTHRGISGPAILQISSYWREGGEIEIALAPNVDVFGMLRGARTAGGRQAVQTVLAEALPKSLARFVAEQESATGNLADLADRQLEAIDRAVNHWRLRPAGSEGYRTAEVTLGGVDTAALDSRTMQARNVPGLFVIGEVVDVTGWLGGYNFQWAWSSGWAAGQVA
ncbi:MAG TPA: NAD(P)/FAD-dependent oxidoreductase [Afifellaceae bacterium]|nr:NAD(P)/FAD-dependent oxidoreductase [Afifellaceae bacterium]